MWHFALIGT